MSDEMLLERQKNSRDMDRKFTVMYLMFATVTFPLQFFLLLYDFDPTLVQAETAKLTFDVLVILFYMQILSNPLILLRGGKGYKKTIPLLKCCNKHKHTVESYRLSYHPRGASYHPRDNSLLVT